MISTHGVPLSLYRDRHSIFQGNDSHWTLAEQLAGQQTPTPVGRALAELGMQQIPAHSPQAKGRVERRWRTCQDRLVSELRLAQATTVEQANVVLAMCCADYNRRFARPAADSTRDFRTLPRRCDLARCLSFRYQRIVSADHVVTLGTDPIALPPRAGQRSYTGDTVELSHQLDGSLLVYRGDQLLLRQVLPLVEHVDRAVPLP